MSNEQNTLMGLPVVIVVVDDHMSCSVPAGTTTDHVARSSLESGGALGGHVDTRRPAPWDAS